MLQKLWYNCLAIPILQLSSLDPDSTTIDILPPSAFSPTPLNVPFSLLSAPFLQLHALGVPAGRFSHVMMDEAGHAEEPLALCAIAGHIGKQCTARND